MLLAAEEVAARQVTAVPDKFQIDLTGQYSRFGNVALFFVKCLCLSYGGVFHRPVDRTYLKC